MPSANSLTGNGAPLGTRPLSSWCAPLCAEVCSPQTDGIRSPKHGYPHSVTMPRSAVLSPEIARARGRIGALVQHSRHDARKTTSAGRAAFLARFEREVDPDLALAPEERARRVDFARRAYFARLAFASAEARRRSHRAGRRAA